MFTPPAEVSAVFAAFAPLFTEPSWLRAQALLCGVLLAPANHTLTAALRALGLAQQPGFQNYHRLLNRACWSARQAAGVLLGRLVAAFVPSGPVVIGLDDTIERRRGRKLTARAIYYDAARSSKACFQKTSGLRWMSLALLVPVHWAARVWALPFLTALCPSERYGPYVRRGRRHKPLVERARGLLGQVRRWLPQRALIVVADTSYAALDLLAWCARQARPVTVITRLRLDAALYAPAPMRRPGRRGRSRLKGKRLPKLAQRLEHAHTRWQACRLTWYGGELRRLQLATGTAVWYHSGKPPVAIRWVLVRDPKKRFEPQAFLSTDLTLEARQIVTYFIRRWSMETTFQEARLYLGLDGQRQWNDLATARTTPVRLGLYSLIALIVQRQPDWQQAFRRNAWYKKARPTFVDALAQVRRALWRQLGFWLSEAAIEKQKSAPVLFEHFAELLAYVA
jgi:DDE superfamily endonuclease